MENYFLAKISSENKKLLEENEIGFCDMEIDGEKGIVIGQDEMTETLSVLGLVINSKKKTPYVGIEKVLATVVVTEGVAEKKKQNEKAKVKVTVNNWDGYQSDKFKKLTEEILYPAVKKKVILSVPHSTTIQPKKDKSFHIFIWSSPIGGKENRPPEKIWGYRVDCRDKAFLPSGQGISIYDEDYAVAELVANNLYIHHDICNNSTSGELNIYRRLLEEVVAELALSPKEKEEKKKKLVEEKLRRSREVYISECSGRFEITLKGLREEVTNAKNTIAKYQEGLVKEIRLLQKSESKLKHLESDSKDELEKYGLEFDKLIALPKVNGVNVSKGKIEVFTETLFCVNPRTEKTHEIGKFRIEIYTDGANNGIRWFNLTRQVEGYRKKMQAPHIWPSGQACLGNAEEIIPELIANYEFSVVAMLAIQFVESVNVSDDAGKYIGNWPVVVAK